MATRPLDGYQSDAFTSAAYAGICVGRSPSTRLEEDQLAAASKAQTKAGHFFKEVSTVVLSVVTRAGCRRRPSFAHLSSTGRRSLSLSHAQFADVSWRVLQLPSLAVTVKSSMPLDRRQLLRANNAKIAEVESSLIPRRTPARHARPASTAPRTAARTLACCRSKQALRHFVTGSTRLAPPWPSLRLPRRSPRKRR